MKLAMPHRPTDNSAPTGHSSPSLRTRIAAPVAAVMSVCALVLGVAAPAHAVGMLSVTGNISCQAVPNIAIGTSATARGTVDFQLNKWDNTDTSQYVSLGYSAAYAPWGWKFIASQGGNFYAYGYESIGSVTAIDRWCMNIFA